MLAKINIEVRMNRTSWNERMKFGAGLTGAILSLWIVAGCTSPDTGVQESPRTPCEQNCVFLHQQCASNCLGQASCESSCNQTLSQCARTCQNPGAPTGQGGQGGDMPRDLGLPGTGGTAGQGTGGTAGQGAGGTGGQTMNCPDRDQDGYQDIQCNPDVNANPRGGDCNDYSNATNPGRAEDCQNDADNDCNGFLPARDPACEMACPDRDADGYQDGECNRDRLTGSDCDDQQETINPAAVEICGNGIDEDCFNGDAPCVMNCVDNDQDGFQDDVDKCPNDKDDRDQFEDEDGCPDPDNDKDGILDINDGKDGACMNSPEDKDGDADLDGCPEEDSLVRISCDEISIGESIYFKTNSDVIQARSYELLGKVAAALVGAPYLKRVRIEGHTDSRGKAAYNEDLSGRRALSVKDFLLETGIKPERLTSEGYGEARPITSNKTKAGRAKNRRVLFTVVERDENCK